MLRSPLLPKVLLAVPVSLMIALMIACDGSGPLATDTTPQPPGPPTELPAGFAALEGAAHGKVIGHLQSVDPVKGVLVLAGGVKVQLTTLSLVDKGGDLTTLAAVKAALDAGIPVLCEADGFLDLGILIVVKIRFVKDPKCSSCDSDDPEDPGSNDSGGSSPPSPNTSTAEFGGHILKIDTVKKSFVIVGGLESQIGPETVMDSENGCECESLDEVKAWMDKGVIVNARIRGKVQNGVTIPKTITFQLLSHPDGDPDGGDSDGDDGNDGGQGKETKGSVVAVDLDARIVTLLGGKKIKVASDALIQLDGDFLTLAKVKAAVDAGIKVRLEAFVVVNLAGILEVTKCRFVKDDGHSDGGDDGSDDPKDDGLVVVTGIVASVNLLDGTCRTTDGQVIKIGSGSIIDLTGDLLSLADVALRLTLGIKVRVEALGILSADALIATKVKFLVG